MKLSAKILSILFVGLLLMVPAFAQVGEGTITGKVIGRDGMPAANVQIRIDRMNTLNANQRIIAQQFETKTGKQGGFSYAGLPPGSYQVSIIESGKIIMIIGDTPGTTITVADGREGSANFNMKDAPAAAAGGAAPAATAADIAADRKALEEAAKNKGTRDKAFAAGTAAYKAKDYEEAAKQFQIVVEVDKKQDVAFANLGNSLNQLKKYDDAAAAYQKAIELKPMEAAYFNNLGLALGGGKKMDDARAAFDNAAKIDPMKAGDYLFNEGAMYFNNGDYPKASEAFKRTLVADPNNKSALLQEAISYFSTPDTMAQAEPLLTKFLTLNPTPADAETAKGLLEAIHTTGPTEYKSDKAIADEKKAADAAAAKAAKDAASQKGKAPAAGKTK